MSSALKNFRAVFSRRKFDAIYFIAIAAAISFIFSNCRSPQKTEMRKLLPTDTIIYLESDDVAATLDALTESPAFQSLAGNKTDFSALQNMQLAVAVSKFEFSENKISDEKSALNFKPSFVAVAETHAWNWQTLSFVKTELNRFVFERFDQSATLEIADQNDGKLFSWTASDGRKFFAFVRDSLIYFGNDRAAIEKCLAVKTGAVESLEKNDFFTRAYSPGNLAFGYVSSDGIAQIADLAGVSLAVEASAEIDGKSFIARIVPPILRNTTKEIVWTANKTPRGIADKISVTLTNETASSLKDSFAPNGETASNADDFLPSDAFAVTRYNLKNPADAWKNLLVNVAKNTDAVSGNFLLRVSNNLLASYGVSDAKSFFNSIDAEILTAQFDENGDRRVSIVTVKNVAQIKQSVAGEIDFKTLPEKQNGAEIWFSADKNLAAAFIETKMILGDRDAVFRCLKAVEIGQTFAKNQKYRAFPDRQTVAVTFGEDADSANKIVEVLTGKKDTNRKLATFYQTATQFTDKGFERETVSDFGLIGVILKQFEK